MTVASRRALVTGAGRGIGSGIVEVLAEHGMAVAVNDLHGDRAQRVADGVSAGGGAACAVPFDVTDYEAVLAGIREAETALGPLDILVNNAGIAEGRRTGVFAQSSPEDWASHVDLNVYGSMHCIRAVLPGMCERGWGRVVQISSASASRGHPAGVGESVYGASKAFTEGLMRHVALEVCGSGVTFNAIAPGVFTAAAAYADPGVMETIAPRIPMGRLGESREIGAAVAWLVSEDAGYVTGQVIHINGGAYQGR